MRFPKIEDFWISFKYRNKRLF